MQKIFKKDLILLCDKYLSKEIDKNYLVGYSWDCISKDEIEFDEEDVISQTLFEWNNEDINYQINETNIKLWRERLVSGKDELNIYNFWNEHIEPQKQICLKYESNWKPINNKLRIGVSKNLTNNPIHGLREQSEKGTTGWFIWTGDYIESKDFFDPMCAEHLLQERPQIIKYLGLETGFRFLVDEKGYEDVWFDEKLTKQYP